MLKLKEIVVDCPCVENSNGISNPMHFNKFFPNNFPERNFPEIVFLKTIFPQKISPKKNVQKKSFTKKNFTKQNFQKNLENISIKVSPRGPTVCSGRLQLFAGRQFFLYRSNLKSALNDFQFNAHLDHGILRPMVKKSAQSDRRFKSYGSFWGHFPKSGQKQPKKQQMPVTIELLVQLSFFLNDIYRSSV